MNERISLRRVGEIALGLERKYVMNKWCEEATSLAPPRYSLYRQSETECLENVDKEVRGGGTTHPKPTDMTKPVQQSDGFI